MTRRPLAPIPNSPPRVASGSPAWLRPLAIVLVVVSAVALTGCGGLLGFRNAVAEPAPPESEPSDSTASDEVPLDSNGTSDGEDELLRLLVEGEDALAVGNAELAVEAFQGYLAFGERGPRTARAMWGLSMALLVPETEVSDPERAQLVLATLAEEHPFTFEGRQARWLQEILRELDQSRTMAAEQAAVIERLNEMVEQLRQIDLNRRPGGVPPDSLSRNPRPGG